MDINKYIARKKNIIDSALDLYIPPASARPAVIHKAMRYAVFPGGKRIRPILTITAFEACGGKGDSILPVACAMELIHCYTLVHDDLPCMDNDDYRRGRLSCHKKFGEDIALLAGDGLLTLAFQVLSQANNMEVIETVSGLIGTRGTIGGQAEDIKGRKGDLRYIAAKKTGALFAAAVKAGGIFKKASKQKIQSLGNFGEDIGFVFQLADDLKDKDGYVKIYGEAFTRKKAEALARRAERHLGIFGKKASVLLELAGLIL